jgi:hypothetical protein
MRQFSCPPTLDIPTLIGSSELETAHNILKNKEKRCPEWGYMPFALNAHMVIEHARSELEAAQMATMGNPIGWAHNQEVARLLFRELGRRGFQAENIGSIRLNLDEKRRPKFGPIIRPCALIHQGETRRLVFGQPRKRLIYTPRQWSIYDWLCKRPFSITDIAGIDVQYLDFHADELGKRQINSFMDSKIEYLSDEEALDLMQRFMRGVEIAEREAPAELFESRRRVEKVKLDLPLFPDLP